MTGEGELEHLDARYRRFAALPDEDRIALIKADRWIGFEQAQAALDRLEALLAYPPRDRMPCLLIYGDTGMGKTKIARKFERTHPARFSQATGVTHRPVVMAQIPSEPVERDLYRELLASLEAPALIGGTLAREKDVCRSLLRTVGARMIVLDEVNGMLAGGIVNLSVRWAEGRRFFSEVRSGRSACLGDLAPNPERALARSAAAVGSDGFGIGNVEEIDT